MASTTIPTSGSNSSGKNLPITQQEITALKHYAIFSGLTKMVNNESEMIAELKKKSLEKVSDHPLLFYVNGKERLFYKHLNPDETCTGNKIGAWAEEGAQIDSSSYSEFGAIVLSGAKVLGFSFIMNGAIIRSGEQVLNSVVGPSVGFLRVD